MRQSRHLPLTRFASGRPAAVIAVTFAAVWLHAVPIARAATGVTPQGPRVGLALQVSDFTWKEELPGGLSLEENGPLFGLQLHGHLPLSSQWTGYWQGEFFAGVVDYDGYLYDLDGRIYPYSAETTYAGVAGAWDVGYDIVAYSGTEIAPFLGLGAHYWLRSLDDDEGFGYDEYWLTLYGRAGLRAAWRVTPGTEVFASGAALLPFFNYEWAVDVPLSESEDDIELEPKERAGYQFEAGINHDPLHVAVFHEYMEFGQSDVDDTGQFLQPESTREVTGLRVGVLF